MSDHHLDGEIVAEEDAAAEDAVAPVRRLPDPAPEAALPVLRPEMKSAAIAAAGGVLAGAATRRRRARGLRRRLAGELLAPAHPAPPSGAAR